MTVGEDVGFHRQDVADDALDRKPAAIELGRDLLDGDAIARELLQPRSGLLGRGRCTRLDRRSAWPTNRRTPSGSSVSGAPAWKASGGTHGVASLEAADACRPPRSAAVRGRSRRVWRDVRVDERASAAALAASGRARVEPQEADHPAVGRGDAPQRPGAGQRVAPALTAFAAVMKPEMSISGDEVCAVQSSGRVATGSSGGGQPYSKPMGIEHAARRCPTATR